MGDGGKCSEKDESNGVGTGDDVQGGGSECATLRDWESSSDKGDAKGAGKFWPSGGPKDSRDVKSASQVGRMGVAIGDGGLGGR